MEKLVRAKFNLYLRNEPKRSSVGILMPLGTTLKCISLVKGEVVKGIDDWYKNEAGLYFWAGGVEEIKNVATPMQRTQTVQELEGGQIISLLMQGQTNPALGEATKFLRKFIDYEFKFPNEPNFDKTQLQCTEYAHFRVKQKLGVTIQWPSTRPRNGKDWPDRLSQSNFCRVLDNPVQNCTMSFTDGFMTPVMQQTGHVAFVEKVFPDGRIRISEINWDNKGSYQERELTEDEWRNRWGGKFIDFL